MAVSEIPTKFQTSDGQEFDNKEEAERHEDVTAAFREWERASEKLDKIIAENTRTADGELFSTRMLQRYYVVRERYGQIPQMFELPWLGMRLRLSQRDEPTIEHRFENGQTAEYEISRLYAKHQNAERALITAQRKWLSEQSASVEEEAAKLGV